MKLDGVDVMVFIDAAAFEAWLSGNHQRQDGVWLKMGKKHSGHASLTSDEAVDVGLCWEWISGQRRPYDKAYYLQKYVPRRARSVWSQANVDKVEAPTAVGRMRAPGLAEVAAAERDGRWKAAYGSQRTATPPPDLIQALSQNDAAGRAFERLNKSDKYSIILQLLKGRTAERRASRLRKLVASVQVRGETL
jgi:uncharacterized protein YdeI (YjbR/CyaY-like superfamily)